MVGLSCHTLEKQHSDSNFPEELPDRRRSRLVPAAVVIPAPIAYIKVVVVKKLVVGSRRSEGGLLASITALWTVVLSEVLGCS